jgi:hypothetical protein
MIRDSLVRVWMIDLKGGTETDRGEASPCLNGGPPPSTTPSIC